MRSDHLAKHTKTHENKAKKLLSKKGDKLEKALAKNGVTQATTLIKQEKIDEDEVKPSIFHPAENINYMDVAKNVNYNDSTASSQSKPSLEDYYQSYHPYQYQYGSNYFHQNSRFYQDKNYFYGLDQNRGMFPSPPAAVASTAPQSSTTSVNLAPTQLTINSVQSQHQNQGGFYQQPSSANYAANGLSNHNGADSNYLLNFNASINNTININTSNLMININNTSTNNNINNTNSTAAYHSQALQQH